MSTDKSHPDSHRSLIKSTSILSLGTLTSRILGFIRDVVLAKLLGTGMKADAFFVAFRIPNLFRDFVGEGATNSALVPVLSEYIDKDKKALWNFISVVFLLGCMILSLLTILGILFTPWIVRAMAPGFIADPQKLSLTIHLTKIMFPYMILIGFTAYSMGILFAFRRFTAPAFSPCLLNIAIIVSAYTVSRHMPEPVLGLAFGILAGGFLQLAAQIGPLYKIGLRFTKPATLNHPGAVKIGKLLIPRMVGSGVYQLTVLIDTFCASLASIVGPGGVSAIYYANRILQFPMGVFSFALSTALLPTFSGQANRKDMTSLKKTLVFSLENIFFIMCPITVIFLLLSQPMIRLCFQRGEFDLYSTAITSGTLFCLAFGLFSFGGIKILVTAFYAMQDTKTPVKVAGVCLFINAALNFLLMFPLKVSGIALASSIAGTIDFLALFYIIDKRLGGLNSGLLKYFLRVSFAGFVMAVFVYAAWNYVRTFNELIKICIIGISAFLLYEAVCLGLGVGQAQKIWGWIFNRKLKICP